MNSIFSLSFEYFQTWGNAKKKKNRALILHPDWEVSVISATFLCIFSSRIDKALKASRTARPSMADISDSPTQVHGTWWVVLWFSLLVGLTFDVTCLGKTYFCIGKAEWQRRRNKETDSRHWSTAQIVTTARSGPGGSQKPQTPHGLQWCKVFLCFRECIRKELQKEVQLGIPSGLNPLHHSTSCRSAWHFLCVEQ